MERIKFDTYGNPLDSKFQKRHKIKRSRRRAEARNYIAENQVLSSKFVDLGKNNPRIFSFPHIEGAALAHQVRVLSKPFEIKQNADNEEIPEQSLAKTKMDEFAKAFLTTVPNRFLRALLRVSGLDNNFQRLNGKRKELLNTFFEPLKQSFIPSENNPNKLGDSQRKILHRFREEKTHRRSPYKKDLVSQGLSDKSLSRVKNTWQNPDREFASAA